MSAYEDKIYYYPIDFEQCIINNVIAGNKDEVMKLMNVLKQKNHTEQKISPRMTRYLGNELSGTALKLCELIKINGTDRIEIIIGMTDKIMGENDITEFHAATNELFCYLCDMVNNRRSRKKSSFIDIVRLHMYKNYSNPDISLSSMASRYNYSETNFSYFFKDSFGINFSDYLEELRINASCELLQKSSLSPEEIATKVGYNSANSFRRAFKRVKGVSPIQYKIISLTNERGTL